MVFIMPASATNPSRSGAIVLAAFATTCLLYPRSETGAEEITGIPRVVDGDTLVVNRQRIRLRAVDAPEKSQICQKGVVQQRCGLAAKEAVERWLLESDGIVSCIENGHDRYGRIVATCRIGKEDIGRRLVREGFAVAYKRYGKDYVDEEREAQDAKRKEAFGQLTFNYPRTGDGVRKGSKAAVPDGVRKGSKAAVRYSKSFTTEACL